MHKLGSAEVTELFLRCFFGVQWVSYFCSFYMRKLGELVVDGAGFAYDMFHFDVSYCEGVADEGSVAAPGQRFRTHQCQTEKWDSERKHLIRP